MAIDDRLRELALTLTRERIVTISRQWEAGITTPAQHEALYLEVDRLVGTAMQAQLAGIAEAGQALQQRLTFDAGFLSWQRNDRALIAEALQALREAITQATTQHAERPAQGDQTSEKSGE